MSLKEILSNVPVKKVASPLNTFVPEIVDIEQAPNPLQEVLAASGMPTEGDHIHDRIVPVCRSEDNRSAIGWIDLAQFDGSEDGRIDWQSFESGMLVSALCGTDICLNNLLESPNHFYFLVDDSGVSGLVTYWSIINSEAFALSVMQSIFEFERSMVRRLWDNPREIIDGANKRFKKLRERLEKTFHENFGKNSDSTPGDLVLSASFGQRIRMLTSAVDTGLLDMKVERKNLESLLFAAQDLRNLYAHPEHVAVRPVWIDSERLKRWMKEWDVFQAAFDQIQPSQSQEPFTLQRWAKRQAEAKLKHEVREPRFSRIKRSPNG